MTATRKRDLLNYLVITIMLVMIGFISLFIFSNIHMKDKMVFRVVQEMDMVSNLLNHAVSDILNDEHTIVTYGKALEYGNIQGVKDIGVFKENGDEAFGYLISPDGSSDGRPPPASSQEKARKIEPYEVELFKKAIKMGAKTDYFDSSKTTYASYIPLKSEGGCIRCHKEEGKLLGVLRIIVSTKGDFDLLENVQHLIWALGAIILLPIGGLLIASVVIREKNRLLIEIKQSNDNLKNTYQDLSETKLYLQMILDNTKALIVTTDTDDKIVELNKEAQRLLEYDKDEIWGKSVLALYRDPDQRISMMNSRKFTEGNKWEAVNREVDLKTKSGKIVQMNLTLSPLVNDDGKVIGAVGIGKDVSEQKMLQYKLIQSEKLAGIGTLASGIAHEINNPLAAILGMAEAIKDEDDITLIKSYTDDIITYVTTANNIVKELSGYSHAAMSESRSTVDISVIIENALKMAKHSASFMSIDIKADLEKDCYVFANEGELQQVLVNLMVNAIHAMEDKGKLTLKCFRRANFVWTTVSDTGQGIPKEYINQIYDPFFTTKPVGKGTGLGLYVVYRIVTKYGGTIEIDSKVGVGTTFTLKFPSGQANADAARQSEAAAQ
jgi:PAS domain S-box-containing protein